MPIKLSTIVNKTRETVVKFAGEEIKIEYRMYVVTPAMLKELEQQAAQESVMQQVETIVKWWDLVDDEGAEIPIKVEAMRGLPMDFLSETLLTIVHDQRGWSKDEKKSSGDGSLTTN